jgi:hypothetical protein
LLSPKSSTVTVICKLFDQRFSVFWIVFSEGFTSKISPSQTLIVPGGAAAIKPKHNSQYSSGGGGTPGS